jgi:hypothetical protein
MLNPYNNQLLSKLPKPFSIPISSLAHLAVNHHLKPISSFSPNSSLDAWIPLLFSWSSVLDCLGKGKSLFLLPLRMKALHVFLLLNQGRIWSLEVKDSRLFIYWFPQDQFKVVKPVFENRSVLNRSLLSPRNSDCVDSFWNSFLSKFRSFWYKFP